MKKILHITSLAALVLAGISLSAQAAVPPDNVGDVTLYGNITANSPMWQWTVNDYPGSRLDAKPSTADTSVAGKVSYPLNGQWFVAATGYLPSFVGTKIGSVASAVGVADITTLTSPDGPVTLSTAGTVATVTLPARGTDTSGKTLAGTLTLNADEMRGLIRKYTDGNTKAANSFLFSDASALAATPGGSCWVGRPGAPTSNLTSTTTATTIGAISDAGLNAASGVTGALNQLFKSADAAGTVQWANLTGYTISALAMATSSGCTQQSSGTKITTPAESSVYDYIAAAHALSLKPQTLTFPAAASGAWNATLTVTAYQM